jgi:protein-disulfide isomerase
MTKAIALVLLFSAAMTPTAAEPAVRKVAVQQDWTTAVAATPQGGFRVGNPAAPVKLVEYGSLACPHCRHFEETGYRPLLQFYVRTGKLSYEYRNLLISGPDISMSLLAHCSGPGKFFAMSQYVYATQPQWQKKLEDMSDADKAALEKMTNEQRIVRYAEIGGMAQIAGRFGVTQAQARQCLADPKGLKRLLDMTEAAEAAGVAHTPTFFVNGKMSESATWETLEPELKAALGKRG